jgi:hypothetical protein
MHPLHTDAPTEATGAEAGTRTGKSGARHGFFKLHAAQNDAPKKKHHSDSAAGAVHDNRT